MVRDLTSDIRHRLRAVFRRDAVEQELDDELRFHIEREAEKNIRAGMTPADADRCARLAFGGVDVAKESSRDARGVAWLEQLGQDLRYAMRSLRKTPGFAAAAVISLGLGIGANSAIFSAIDAFLFRSLAVERPDELVTLEQVSSGGARQFNLSYGDLARFRALREVFSGASGTSWAEAFNVRTDDPAAASDQGSAHVSVVTGDYFPMLGLNPRAGRLLAESDDGDDVGGHPVVVISDSYWQRKFDRSPSAVGRALIVNGTTFTVVGVAPARYTGDWVGWTTDTWVPSAMIAAMHPEQRSASRSRFQFKVIARVRRGVPLSRVQAATTVLYQQLQTDPPAGSGIDRGARLEVRSAANGYSPQRDSFARPLSILMVIVGAVLLIACANIANLLLARASARRREISLRYALGAGRGRIIRQLMTESLGIALAGGALGLAIGTWGMSILATIARSGPMTGVATNANPVSVDISLRPDARVVAFTLSLCVITCVLFGLMPAFRGSKVALNEILSGASRTGERGGRAGRNGLVVVQVALSLILLVGTGLFVRSLRNLEEEQLGFDREHLLLIWALPGHTGTQGREIAARWETIAERVSGVPGVTSASVSIEGLLGGGQRGGPLMTVEGHDASDSVRIQSTSTVSPGFFSTVGQTLLSGREFARTDSDSSQSVVIINRTLAARLFGSTDAVGHRVLLRGVAAPLTIVGVVADAKQTPRTPNGPAVYYPPRQNLNRLARGMCVIVRTATNPSAVTLSVRRTIADVDAQLPILNIDTIDGQLNRTLFHERLLAAMSIAFGALALLLSCVGLYGVVSYVTIRRTKEIGVRMALGATSGHVLGGVFRESVSLVTAGILIGAAVGLGLARTVEAQLYGVRSTDPADARWGSGDSSDRRRARGALASVSSGAHEPGHRAAARLTGSPRAT